MLAAAVALAILLAVAWATLQTGTPQEGRWRLLGWYAAAWLAFGAAAALLLRVPVRAGWALLAGGALALQVVAIGFPPTTTDDFYRYVWDGKVQAAGIDPYRYAPLDPALVPLRDPWLFPPDERPADTREGAVAAGSTVTDLCTSRGVAHDCTRINRPGEHTIYPPVAQAYFLGLHHLSPDDHRQRAAQVAAAALALATTGAIAFALRRSGRDPRAAVLWAWCPVTWLESGNNAHVDVLGILLLVMAIGLLDGPGSEAERGRPGARRTAAAGALLGVAVAVKLVPALAAPGLLSRCRTPRGATILLGSAGAVFALGYLPHVATVGTGVLGYLPGYLREEGYAGTERFAALRLIVPDGLAPAIAVLLLAMVTLAVWPGMVGVRTIRIRPVRFRAPEGALLVTGTAFVLVGPSQPWYGLMIVALVALCGRWEWLGVAAAAYPVYLAGSLGVANDLMQQWTYLPAAAFVAAVATVRRARSRADRLSPGAKSS